MILSAYQTRRTNNLYWYGSVYGFILVSSRCKGKRFALPNAEVMIHQPLGGAQGQATEIEIAANHILKHVKIKSYFIRTYRSIY